MKAATLVQMEFIGLKAKVVRSSTPDCVGVSGKITDETRNTLVIRHNNEDKTVAKETAVFQFTLRDGSVIEVDGVAILGRPEDRVKRRTKRQW